MDPAHLVALAGAPFFKLCGSGNDFVGFDGREVAAPSRDAIAALCDRRRGVGADGVVRLTPGRDGGVFLEYWNSDGSDAALCGNGTLCSSVLARQIGLAASDSLVLETGAGRVAARVLGSARAEIGLGSIATPRRREDVSHTDGERSIHFTVAGVPHLVVTVADPRLVDLPRRGRELRFHPALGAPGANVNFVAATEEDGAFAIRTYERGVEGETLACGTGAVATALTLLATGQASREAVLRTAGGSLLAIRARCGADRCDEVTLTGEGRVVFRGVIVASGDRTTA